MRKMGYAAGALSLAASLAFAAPPRPADGTRMTTTPCCPSSMVFPA
ncbi:hypothetical protein [Arthrobacter sp. SD76]